MGQVQFGSGLDPCKRILQVVQIQRDLWAVKNKRHHQQNIQAEQRDQIAQSIFTWQIRYDKQQLLIIEHIL